VAWGSTATITARINEYRHVVADQVALTVLDTGHQPVTDPARRLARRLLTWPRPQRHESHPGHNPAQRRHRTVPRTGYASRNEGPRSVAASMVPGRRQTAESRRSWRRPGRTCGRSAA
jgi:hypothetical protein